VGLQVIGARFQDARVLRVAHAYEQATQATAQRSPMVAEAAA
jgi:Asp-tRNA(Asn)/Glu-tRNA(Gln) amidotransferase A subunit family amidase